MQEQTDKLSGEESGVVVTCWASELGDCDTKQSAEHYVTRGLWSASQIMISGFDWQKGEQKMLPVGALESKILCETHNNRLSDVDAEAIRISRFFGDAVDAVKALTKQNPGKKPLLPERLEANGPLFECWCAKTLIDFVCVEKSDTIWHDSRTPVIEPPIGVLRAIYGFARFHYPMGLYLAQENTERPQQVLREAIIVDPRFHPESGGLVEAFLGFKDFRFLVWLTTEPFELFSTEVSGGVAFGGAGNEVHYHPDALKIAIDHVVRYKLLLKWT